MRFLVSKIFAAYRCILSPLLQSLAGPGFGCRYEPSCSRYAEQAIARHGGWRGVILTLGRLMRCHPFSRHPTQDPVP